MTKTHCPHCHQPVTSTVDADTCGLPITLHPKPTTRTHALLHVINGGQAVFAEHDTTWGERATRYYALTAGRIGNPHLAHYPHYVTHACGETPPPVPPRPDTTTNEKPEY